ncbi:pyridoxamine 5'-phosphate oxidase family protein, partial [Deltaproteobacteria bacterium OttesenSCG-928-K17]|nr:pyridoxamine 5'-phosphate oxidase family protein [Deltaproteobacteria bacterium OttesenSCG-928-K17]
MREIRRKDRALSLEETKAVLKAGEYAVVATKDADGRPYAVPLSYVWLDDRIVIHCAHDGRKTEAF